MQSIEETTGSGVQPHGTTTSVQYVYCILAVTPYPRYNMEYIAQVVALSYVIGGLQFGIRPLLNVEVRRRSQTWKMARSWKRG